MLSEEQRVRLLALGEEQLAIAEKWDKEQEERRLILDTASELEKAGDGKAYLNLIKQFLEVSDKTHCEHERSIWSSCMGCDEIYRALTPERYCSKCESELDEDEPTLVKGKCDSCSQDSDD